MKDIPGWVIKVIETNDLNCNKCKKILSVDRLISIGVQESAIAPHTDKLCIGLNCLKCKEMTIFEIKDMSLIEFAFELLDKETETEKPKKKSKSRDVLKELSSEKSSSRRKSKNMKSKITKREVNEVARFLKNANTHEDFLVAMGMSPEQISKYNYKKGKEGQYGG